MNIETVSYLARRALSRAAVETLFLKSGLNLTKPNDIRATLTERCNYRCGYCNHWRQKSYTDEMSGADWQVALLSVRRFIGRFSVQFLGGEPTMVPWFFELAQFCSHNGIDWGTITNGSTLSAKRVAQIVAARPLNIDISIDSRTVATHDGLRGIEGSLRHISEGVQRLVEERQRAGRRFAIRIKPTVTRQTIGDLNDIVTWAETMPAVMVDFSPVRLWRPDEIAAYYPHEPQDYAALDEAIEQLVRRKEAGAPIETSAAKLRSMPAHFQRLPNNHGVEQCRVGLRSVDIRPNGDVNHCWKFGKVGNLRQSSMAEIWKDLARRDVVRQTIGCDLFKTTCSTTCLAHRTMRQDISRGLRMISASLL